jgi:HK97 family phage portal protein
MPEDKSIPQVNSYMLNLPVPPARKSSEFLNAYKSWVYTCVNAISQEVASMKLHLYKKKYVYGKLKVEEVVEHEALSALYYVNTYSTSYDFWYGTQTYMELLGEAYWGIIRGKNDSIASMWLLRPDWVSIQPSNDKIVDHYIYSIGGSSREQVKIETRNVIPFKTMNPNNPYRGKGSVQAAAMAIDLDEFSASWNRNFFFNSALPSLFFKTESNPTKEQVDRFMHDFQAKFQGIQNSQKIAFLTGGLDVKDLNVSAKDMDFIEQRKAMRDEILAIFRVPKSIIGLTEDVNRANAEATIGSFMSNVVTPKMRILVSYLNEFYLKNWEKEDLFFDFEDPAPEDTELKLKVYDSGLSKGWLTKNEVRIDYGVDPIEGGDILYVPTNLVPMNGTTDEKPSKGSKASKKEKYRLPKLNVSIPPRDIRTLNEEKLKEGLKVDLIKIISTIMKSQDIEEGEDKEQKKMELKEAYWRQMIEKTDVWEANMASTLVKLFTTQEAEVLENLNEEYKAISDVLFDAKKNNKDWKLVLLPIIKRVVEDKTLEELDFLGVGGSLSLQSDTLINYIERDSMEFVSSVNTTTRNKLKKTLSDGVKLGEDADQLAKRIRDIYKEATENRAKMIARTEVMRANNFATQEAYRQSGIVVGKEWLTAIDERTCPYCNELDGKILSLKDNYFSSSFGKISEPPLHPRCRCTTMPVFDKELLRTAPDRMFLKEMQHDVEEAKEEVIKAQNLKEAILDEAKIEKERILKNTKIIEKEKAEELSKLKSLRNKIKDSMVDDEENNS